MKILNKHRIECANFIGVPVKQLTYVIYGNKIENFYENFEIAKKSGGVRKISAPYGHLKVLQQRLAEKLWEKQKLIRENNGYISKISHAFEKEKSIITNAEQHRNKRYVMNIDLEDFFDTFHFGRVKGFFEKNKNFNLSPEAATLLAQIVCYRGKLPQGAPSSPIITNLICEILDFRLLKSVKKYKVQYTRYADDLTFSTNDKNFGRADVQKKFMQEITEEIERFGFKINHQKTRLQDKHFRQDVTGLVVNSKINVKRDFYKKTRAMSDALYKNGEFLIDDEPGTLNQLEGRFTFINQLSWYNNKKNIELGKEKPSFHKLSTREKEFQKFLFYKYLFANPKPVIITEGKTDIPYLKSALKSMHAKYPQLIKKNGDEFEFKVTFLRRTKRLHYFLNLVDGADSMKNVVNFYQKKGGDSYPNYFKYFAGYDRDKNEFTKPTKPVIFVFDNEQNTNRPLKGFIAHVKRLVALKNSLNDSLFAHIVGNIYILTNPLTNGNNECEIEDLFDDEVLNVEIGPQKKKFSRENEFDTNKFFGKEIFSRYIEKNYEKINFDNFKPIFDSMCELIDDYEKKNLFE